ncbi:MAG: hypothetical protein V2A71_08855 [Candidatus Eisenbacteria bacterium]
MYHRTGFHLLVVTLTAISLAFAASPDALAGEVRETQPGQSDRFQKGSWSMQFVAHTQGGYWFSGIAVSAKRHFSPGSALRFGLGVNVNTTDRTRDRLRDDSVWDRSAEEEKSESSSRNLELDMLYLHYSWPRATVRPFWGCGPFLQFSHSNDTDEYLTYEAGEFHGSRSEYHSRSWGLGAVAAGGIEWFVSSSCSLYGEYKILVAYERSRYSSGYWTWTDTQRHSSSESITTGWSMGRASTELGVSVYF